MLKKQQIDKIFARLAEDNPSPKTELEYTNTYTLLVAVVLSAQATDVGVNKATKALFALADTPLKMLELGEDGLKEHIKTIGLYNNKAQNIIALSRKLIEKFQGQVPRNREALETLPGVGRKTANVVLNCAWGEPTIAVDTHVFRVSNRTGITESKNALQTEEQLMEYIPKKWQQHAHHWLILHGRYICKARTPLCGQCRIADICEYEDKSSTEL